MKQVVGAFAIGLTLGAVPIVEIDGILRLAPINTLSATVGECTLERAGERFFSEVDLTDCLCTRVPGTHSTFDWVKIPEPPFGSPVCLTESKASPNIPN